jgi:hypothetical protein
MFKDMELNLGRCASAFEFDVDSVIVVPLLSGPMRSLYIQSLSGQKTI